MPFIPSTLNLYLMLIRNGIDSVHKLLCMCMCLHNNNFECVRVCVLNKRKKFVLMLSIFANRHTVTTLSFEATKLDEVKRGNFFCSNASIVP